MATPMSLYAEGLEQFKKDVQPRIRDKDDDKRMLREFLSSRVSPSDAREAGKVVAAKAAEKYDPKDKDIPRAWISHVLGNFDHVIAFGNWATEGAPETVGMA